MKTCISFVALLAAGVAAAVANADMVNGDQCGVNGYFTGAPGTGGFGTAFNQGEHTLGTTSNYFDSVWGAAYPVWVTSTVVNPYSATFDFDFTSFFPGDYATFAIDILGLKNDGTLIGVQGNSSGFSVNANGNGIHWEGTGAELATIGHLSFKVYQSPAPGAVALLGVAGLAGSRRRRA